MPKRRARASTEEWADRVAREGGELMAMGVRVEKAPVGQAADGHDGDGHAVVPAQPAKGARSVPRSGDGVEVVGQDERDDCEAMRQRQLLDLPPDIGR